MLPRHVNSYGTVLITGLLVPLLYRTECALASVPGPSGKRQAIFLSLDGHTPVSLISRRTEEAASDLTSGNQSASPWDH